MNHKPLTVPMLADRWSVSEQTVNDLIDSGRLGSFPIGPHTWRVAFAECERASELIQSGVSFSDMPIVCGGRIRPSYTKRRPIPVRGVYFIDCGPYTKIGFTARQFRFRLDALKTGNPFDVVLWAAVPGDIRLEKRLHDEFAGYHHQGEWFQFDAEGRKAVKRRVSSLGGRIVRRASRRMGAA